MGRVRTRARGLHSSIQFFWVTPLFDGVDTLVRHRHPPTRHTNATPFSAKLCSSKGRRQRAVQPYVKSPSGPGNSSDRLPPRAILRIVRSPMQQARLVTPLPMGHSIPANSLRSGNGTTARDGPRFQPQRSNWHHRPALHRHRPASLPVSDSSSTLRRFA